MQQLLRVLKKSTLLIFGLFLCISIPSANAELDLRVQQEIMDAISVGVARYEDESQDISKYDQGLLENYGLDAYDETHIGEPYIYLNGRDLYEIPECCEPDLYFNIFAEIHYNTNQEILDAASDEAGYYFESSFIENFTSQSSVPEALKERQRLDKIYNEQKEIITITNRHMLRTKAFEIYANESTMDSNFDLIDDLLEIESLLFGSNIPWSTFQFPAPNQDTISQPVNLDPNYQESDIDEVIEDIQDDVNNEIPTDPDNPENPNNSNAPVQDFTPDQCGVTPQVAQALESQNNLQGANQDPSNSSDQAQPPQNQEEEEQSDRPSRNSNISLPTFGFSNPNTSIFECYTGNDVVFSTIGDETKPFCFYIKEVRQPLTLQTANNTCTNCLLEGMAQEFQKTNDSNLIPQKLTGNYFELPFCKKDILNKINSVNIDFIARPIFQISSPNKAIEDINPAKMAQNYRSIKRIPPPINFSDADNFIEVVNQIQELQQAQVQELVDRDLKFTLENESSTQTTVVSQISDRMELFNKNLKSLNDIIFAIKDTAKLFLSKPVCQ